MFEQIARRCFVAREPGSDKGQFTAVPLLYRHANVVPELTLAGTLKRLILFSRRTSRARALGESAEYPLNFHGPLLRARFESFSTLTMSCCPSCEHTD